MKAGYLLLLAAMTCVSGARADDATECNEFDDYSGWFDCEIAQARAADDELNAIYRQVMERMSPVSNELGRNNLRNAQRAWIAFRDAECRFRTEALGSVAGAIDAGCANRLTRHRIEELRYYLTCFEDDLRVRLRMRSMADAA